MKESDVNAVTRRYQRVLVPLDGSPLGESIIPFIRDIAGPLDMDIVLVRVVSPVVAQMNDATSQIIMTIWRRERRRRATISRPSRLISWDVAYMCKRGSAGATP